MSYTSETINYGRSTDQVFIHENGIGFDFSDRSPVTFIQFNGLGGPTTSSIARTLVFWKKHFFNKLGQHVNVVSIRDANRDHGVYIANYLGIMGVCDSFFGIANILNEKLYTNGTTKKTVVFADSGGSIPAILTSADVPYHSLNLTTPYLKVIGGEHEFDVSQFTNWLSRKHCIYAHDNVGHMKSYFNVIDFLDDYVQNPSVQLNMHWSTDIIGTDLLFRNNANALKHYANVSIEDHETPPEIDGHMLLRHLINTKKYYSMVNTEIRAQFAALGIETKSQVTGL